MPAAQHIGCVRTASTSKSAPYMARRRIKVKREGIEFQVCRNPDVKCAVVERVNRTLLDKLHRYFTYKNTYKYIDVLPKFVKEYNATVHSTTGMAPADVSDTDVLTTWNKMSGKADKTRRLSMLKFRVGQHVRISE